MKIRAIKGSELEKTIIKMRDQLLKEENEAKEMIKEYCGYMPDSIGYQWALGMTAAFSCNIISFNDPDIKPNNLVPNNSYTDRLIWRPTQRTKDGKEFIRQWNRKFQGINGDVLSEFGIPVMHEKTGIYCHWLPLEDEDGYYLSVGSSLLDRMPSSKSDQFFIEV